jgi:hypothetical protein
MFEKLEERYGLDWSDLGWRPVEDSCEYGNELSGSVKYEKFLSS